MYYFGTVERRQKNSSITSHCNFISTDWTRALNTMSHDEMFEVTILFLKEITANEYETLKKIFFRDEIQHQLVV